MWWNVLWLENYALHCDQVKFYHISLSLASNQHFNDPILSDSPRPLLLPWGLERAIFKEINLAFLAFTILEPIEVSYFNQLRGQIVRVEQRLGTWFARFLLMLIYFVDCSLVTWRILEILFKPLKSLILIIMPQPISMLDGFWAEDPVAFLELDIFVKLILGELGLPVKKIIDESILLGLLGIIHVDHSAKDALRHVLVISSSHVFEHENGWYIEQGHQGVIPVLRSCQHLVDSFAVRAFGGRIHAGEEGLGSAFRVTITP